MRHARHGIASGSVSVLALCLEWANDIRIAPSASPWRRVHSSLTLPLVLATIALGLLAGCAPAPYRLAACVSFSAAHELRRAAAKGDAQAQHDLGLYHFMAGISGPPLDDRCTPGEYYARSFVPSLPAPFGQDHAEAVRWWRRAADQGHGLAQLRLGHMYANGLGVNRDDHQAGVWWRRAVEQWRRAAGQGDSDAQFYLGHMYHRGYGVPQDESRALAWWRRAADQEQPGAMRALGETENVPPLFRGLFAILTMRRMEVPTHDVSTARRVEPTLAFRTVDDGLLVTYTVLNASGRPLRFAYDSGQQFELTLTNDDGEVWRWSQDRSFTMALWEASLLPAASIVIEERLRWPDGNEILDLTAYLTVSPRNATDVTPQETELSRRVTRGVR